MGEPFPPELAVPPQNAGHVYSAFCSRFLFCIVSRFLFCILAPPPILHFGPPHLLHMGPASLNALWPASFSAFWPRLLFCILALPPILHFGAASYSAFWPNLLICILAPPPHVEASPTRISHALSKHKPRLLCILAPLFTLRHSPFPFALCPLTFDRRPLTYHLQPSQRPCLVCINQTSHAPSKRSPHLLCILAPLPQVEALPNWTSHAPSKRMPRLLCTLVPPPHGSPSHPN